MMVNYSSNIHKIDNHLLQLNKKNPPYWHWKSVSWLETGTENMAVLNRSNGSPSDN